MDEQENKVDYEKTLVFYISGFVLSIVLTLAAYRLVVSHAMTGMTLIVVLVELAVIQFLVQLYFFLHFGSEQKPRWRLLTVVLMLFFVLVVVLGSIWIMHNLGYRMSPEQMNTYMQSQADGGL